MVAHFRSKFSTNPATGNSQSRPTATSVSSQLFRVALFDRHDSRAEWDRCKSAAGGRFSSCGESCISIQWAIQPGSRPMANSTVNICTGMPDRAIDDAGVEIDVRIELPLDEVRIGERRLFELLGDVEDRIVDVPLGQQLVAGRS